MGVTQDCNGECTGQDQSKQRKTVAAVSLRTVHITLKFPSTKYKVVGREKH